MVRIQKEEVFPIESLGLALKGGRPSRAAWTSASEHYLLRGARNGDEGIVRSALNQRANPDVMDPEEGCSPLILACQAGSLNSVQLLCRSGADPHAVDPQGVSAVRASLVAKKPLIAAYIVQHSRGKVVDNQKEFMDTLQLLVNQCPPPPQKLASMSEHEVCQVRESSSYACTCLMKALLEFPLPNNAWRIEATRQGLWQSIYTGNEGAVAILLSAKVDPSVPDKDDGRTALDLAYALREEGISDEIVRCGGQPGPEKDLPEWALCLAAARGDDKAARLFLADVTNPNWRHKSMLEDFTPLMYACAEGSEVIVDLLLDLKANAAMVDKMGRTPLMIARERGHKQLLPPYRPDSLAALLERRTRADVPWMPNEKEVYIPIVQPVKEEHVPIVEEVAPIVLDQGYKGKLTILIIKCTALYDADLLGIGNLSDPYVHLRVAKAKSKEGADKRNLVKKTSVINDSLNPVYNESFTFGPVNLQEDEVRINVFDEDPFTGLVSEEMFRDQFLGKLVIPLKEKADMLKDGTPWSINKRLKSQPADHLDGKVELKISFTPQSAATQERASNRQNNAFAPQGVSSRGSPATSKATSGTSTPAKAAAPQKTQHHDPF